MNDRAFYDTVLETLVSTVRRSSVVSEPLPSASDEGALEKFVSGQRVIVSRRDARRLTLDYDLIHRGMSRLMSLNENERFVVEYQEEFKTVDISTMDSFCATFVLSDLRPSVVHGGSI